MPNRKLLIVIGGPTASGKTGVAIEVSRHFDCPIVSADSRQFYQEMSIGTAKPTPAERAAAPHFLVNHLSVTDTYSVGDYTREALALLDDIYAQHSVAILVGGTGLYLKALCEGIDEFPTVPPAVKAAVEADLAREGITFLQRELQLADPTYYAKVDTQNPVRLVRAVAVIRASGQPFSSFLQQKKPVRPFECHYFCLLPEREALYNRINQRVDAMLAQGLEAEARQLYPLRTLNALQTVGYQELFSYFSGEIDYDTAVERIKRNSRRYAKRQMTWFRNQQPTKGNWTYLTEEPAQAIIQAIETTLQTQNK